MLRRKMLLVMASVVALLLAGAVSAVLLLQVVLRDLEHASADAIQTTAATTAMHVRMTDLHQALDRCRESPAPQSVEGVQFILAGTRDSAAELNALHAVLEADASANNQIQGQLAELERLMSSASAMDQIDVATIERGAAMAGAIDQQLDSLQESLREHIEGQQRGATARFRTTAVVLGILFVIVLNASVMMLSRIGSMILKPVDRLVEASRRLAREEFDYRIDVPLRDEFGELAEAYNHLAAQLQANEARKVETLHQVARTLNHELNNAIAIIQLQLNLVARDAAADDPQGERLREMHRTLNRMANTIATLTRVRKIVLTDYVHGVKMLDLQASVADETARPDADSNASAVLSTFDFNGPRRPTPQPRTAAR